jgi:hypothetical protein
VRVLRTEAKVDYLAQKGERVKLTMTFVVDRPAGGLRIDAESPLGGTVASLAADGRSFQLLDARANRFLTGAAAPCNLARLIGVRLRPADVIEVVAGGAPLLGPASTASVRWDPHDGGREVLVLRGQGGLTETIKLTPGRWDVAAAEVAGADGKPLYRLTHDEFSDEGGVRLPGRSTIVDPGRPADVKIRYRSREANPSLPPGVFHLEVPAGMAAEPVTCEE